MVNQLWHMEPRNVPHFGQFQKETPPHLKNQIAIETKYEMEGINRFGISSNTNHNQHNILDSDL